ncbi:tetratricopeptide repeat protein [Bacteroidota bacterium]
MGHCLPKALAVIVVVWLGVTAQPLRVCAQTKSILQDSLVANRAERGLHFVYNMEFDSAAVVFAEISRRYQSHPIGPFFQGLNVWWQIMVDFGDTRHDKRFNSLMQKVIDLSEELLDHDSNSVDGMFFKGLGLSFRGRLHSNRRHWIRAIRDAKGAVKQVVRLAESDAENNDFYFGWGVYDYFSEAIVDDHKLLAPLTVFFPNGDRERGIRELTRTFKDGRFLRAEAAYFLCQIYTYFQPRYDKSLEYATWLRVRYPRNTVFRLLEGRAYARFGKWDESDQVFRSELGAMERGAMGYTDAMKEEVLYYLARGEMSRGAFDLALDYLKRLNDLASRTEKETPFKVLGLLRQGMSFDALGYRDYALYRYRQVKEMKNWSQSRQRALRYTKQPYTSPVQIVRNNAGRRTAEGS